MPRLPLDDPRWSELLHRGGAASDVPHQLRHLLNHPDDAQAFGELWPYLCSEGTAWPAAFAAAPYIVELAEKLPAGKRLEHLVVLGLVRMAGHRPQMPAHLEDAYAATHATALAMIGSELVFQHDPANTRFLLAAAAALKGYPKIADAIESLDWSAEGQAARDIEG